MPSKGCDCTKSRSKYSKTPSKKKVPLNICNCDGIKCAIRKPILSNPKRAKMTFQQQQLEQCFTCDKVNPNKTPGPTGPTGPQGEGFSELTVTAVNVGGQTGVCMRTRQPEQFLIMGPSGACGSTGMGFIAATCPDFMIPGGNLRGQGAIDWQICRSGEEQVASGDHSHIGGGHSNAALGNYSVVGGGRHNTAGGSGTGAFVGAGQGNLAFGDYSAVVGGSGNQALADLSIIGGGSNNGTMTSAMASHIGGGILNVTNANLSSISGGYDNTTDGMASFIGAGQHNTAAGENSSVLGGNNNHVKTVNSLIGGGSSNTISGADHSQIMGGRNNKIEEQMGMAPSDHQVILGGEDNLVATQFSTIINGLQNTIDTVKSTDSVGNLIGHGNNNHISGYNTRQSTIVNGSNNLITGTGQNHTILAGSSHKISPSVSSNDSNIILAGFSHTITGGVSRNLIANGFSNDIGSSRYSTILNGNNNTVVDANYVTVINGANHDARAHFSTIAGGYTNSMMGAAGGNRFIGGGQYNSNMGANASIVGGSDNLISSTATDAFIGGGCTNTLTGSRSAILCGEDNVVRAEMSSIAGGEQNQVNAMRSHIAAGSNNYIGPDSSDSSIASGGFNVINCLSNAWGSIGGGYQNLIDGNSVVSHIANGYSNHLTNTNYSMIGSGASNTITGANQSTIIGGYMNSINGVFPSNGNSICGGSTNLITGSVNHNVIVNGQFNEIRGDVVNYSSIGGGQYNKIVQGEENFLGAGARNTISGSNKSIIVGGDSNLIFNCTNSFIGSGQANVLTGSSDQSSIVSGSNNRITQSINSHIGGGASNLVPLVPPGYGGCTISGGRFNQAWGQDSTVAGGYCNAATADRATVGGGQKNEAGALGAFVGGGAYNKASNNYSAVVSGKFNNYSIGTDYTNAAAITINEGAAATPYPSTITITGATGLVTNVTVTLDGLTHPDINDLDILLEGPGLERVLLLSRGHSSELDGSHEITFTDTGGNHQFIQDNFNNACVRPAMGEFVDAGLGIGPYPFGLQNAFSGTPPNGDWNLYVYDRGNTASTGTISAGWSLHIVTTATQIIAGGYSFIGAGEGNQASGEHSSVVGGKNNKALGAYTFVGGGQNNTAGGSGTGAFVGAGRNNVAVGENSSVVGGSYNRVSGDNSSILAGTNNIVTHDRASIIGGVGMSSVDDDTVLVAGKVYFDDIPEVEEDNLLVWNSVTKSVSYRDINSVSRVGPTGPAGGPVGPTGPPGSGGGGGGDSPYENTSMTVTQVIPVLGSGNSNSGQNSAILVGNNNTLPWNNSSIVGGENHNLIGWNSLSNVTLGSRAIFRDIPERLDLTHAHATLPVGHLWREIGDSLIRVVFCDGLHIDFKHIYNMDDGTPPNLLVGSLPDTGSVGATGGILVNQGGVIYSSDSADNLTQSLYFSGGAGDYVADLSSNLLAGVLDNFHMEVIVKSDTIVGNAIIFYVGDPSTNGFGIMRIGDRFVARLGGVIDIERPTALSVGFFYNVAIVRTATQTRLYINKINVASTLLTPITGTAQTLMGGDSSGSLQFEGNIDLAKVSCFNEGSFSIDDLDNTVTPSGYGFIVGTKALETLSGSEINTGINNHDTPQGPFPIGFTFSFYNIQYTEFAVSPDGWITLEPSSPGLNSDWSPDFNDPDNRPLIFPHWDDHNGAGGLVVYDLQGTAPNRKLIIDWNITLTGTSGQSTMQCVLYETLNKIEFIYGTIQTGANGFAVGLRDENLSNDPNVYQFVSVAVATNTASDTVITNSNSFNIPGGTLYTFTPL